MSIIHLPPFLSALLLLLTLTAQNASGGAEIKPSPRGNAQTDIETEVKSKLDEAFKDKKFDAGGSPKAISVLAHFSAPEEIRTRVATTVGQELKKLADVSLGIEDVDFDVSIVASVVSNAGNQPLYIISLVVAKSPAAVRANPKQVSALIGHTLETGEQLEDLCKRVVIETNTHVFEQERKVRKMAREMSPTPSSR